MSSIDETTSSSTASSSRNGGHPPTVHPHGMAAIFLKLMGVKPMEGGEVVPGVTRILSGYSSAYIISVDEEGQEYVLVDTGADPNADELLAVLRHKGVDASAVKAVFLTHGHLDHSAGLHKFTAADVYVGAGDHDFIIGTAAADGFIPHLQGKKPELAVADPAKLHDAADGQAVTVGNRQIRFFSIPGHTRGSMAYLIDGILFVGDATTFGPKGDAQKPPVPVSYDVAEEIHSLAHLARRFQAEGIHVDTVVPSHSGTGTWQSVLDLAGTEPA